MILCVDCKHELDGPTYAASKTLPCEFCGSTSRLDTVDVAASDEFILRATVAHRESSDGTEALRKSDGRGQQVAADSFAVGNTTLTVEGPSHEGESDTLAACEILVLRLNRDRGKWQPPIELTGREGREVDCVTSNGEEQLHIQVTRPVPSETFWKAWGQLGHSEEAMTVSTASRQLLNCASAKAKEIPREQLANLILAINAMDTPTYALNMVTENFKTEYAQIARELGFKAIWIIGPVVELTCRLDE